ncbi:CoA-dependent acyltransferase, partial [Trichoderma reesei RUT C-30]
MYNPDGTIEFCSRRDTQVKIRGLRVELSEVEYRIRESLEGICQVAVDISTSDGGSRLVSYLCFTEETRSSTSSENSMDDILMPITVEVRPLLAAMVGKLRVSIPNYMIPTLFIVCRYMPSITSTKLDRTALRQVASLLTQDQISMYSLSDDNKRPPETDMERKFQSLWASILSIPADSIGRDDSFLQIGGDSISAIHLVSTARAEGLVISVKDVFDDSRLLAIAAKAVFSGKAEGRDNQIAPFSLLPPPTRDAIVMQAAEQCGIAQSAIDDAYPATSIQEGLMALSVKQRGSYVAKYVYRLASQVDIGRFKAAWMKTVELCGALRTRIILFDDSSIQVLLKDPASWEATDKETLSSLVRSDRGLQMSYGTPLCWYATVQEADTSYFVWSAHHAIYDGWTIRLILSTLESIYRNVEPSPLQAYNAFVKYTLSLDHDAATNFWANELQGSKRASFP